MKLGTHNSMTYLKPKHWWLYPFRFIAKCQSMTLEEQYNYGIRHFDLRISFAKDSTIEFRHGLVSYKSDVYTVLSYLNSSKEPVYCRLWLECSKEDLRQENLFKYYCEIFEKHYKNIRFYGGRSKKKNNLYSFKYEEPENIQCYASFQLPLIDDLWPWLYAKRHNKEAKHRFKNDLLILDFVLLG